MLRLASIRKTPRFLAGLALFGCLTALGCGAGHGPQRVPLRGSVTLNSEPAEALVLNLVPANGNSGPAANIQINGGQYAFTRQNGPIPGPHEATITYYPPPNGGPASEGTSNGLDKQTFWKFEIDVPGTSPFEENFDLNEESGR